MDEDARERIKQFLLNDPDPQPGYFTIRHPTSENPSIESVPCQVPGCEAVAVDVRDDVLFLCRKHFDEGSVGSA